MNIRGLDIEDLYILSLLWNGYNMASISKLLGYSQPAITARVIKIERELGVAILDRTTTKRFLTESGKNVCKSANESLCILENIAL